MGVLVPENRSPCFSRLLIGYLAYAMQPTCTEFNDVDFLCSKKQLAKLKPGSRLAAVRHAAVSRQLGVLAGHHAAAVGDLTSRRLVAKSRAERSQTASPFPEDIVNLQTTSKY